MTTNKIHTATRLLVRRAYGEAYLGAIKASGFTGIKLLSDRLYSPSGVCPGPITDKAARALEGAASSITVFAVKPRRKTR